MQCWKPPLPHTCCTKAVTIHKSSAVIRCRMAKGGVTKGGICLVNLQNRENSLKIQNCLQWGRSNLVDPAEWPKIHLLNRDIGEHFVDFPRKNSKTQSSPNFLQSGPRKVTKSGFSGLAPIRWVLKNILIFSQGFSGIFHAFFMARLP